MLQFMRCAIFYFPRHLGSSFTQGESNECRKKENFEMNVVCGIMRWLTLFANDALEKVKLHALRCMNCDLASSIFDPERFNS